MGAESSLDKTPLLVVEDLRTEIDLRKSVVKAVDGVSLTVEAGETVGVVGESGCGKSITAMSVMRLLPAGGRITGGNIRFNGQEITRVPDSAMRRLRGNEVSMVFQDPMTSLNPTMTVGDQVAWPVRTHRQVSRREGLERAAEVLELVGVPSPRERLRTYPHQLSGGLRQRVMIAMALACEPRLLIADEPTTALDVTVQAQILALLADLKDRLHLGMLLITHDMGVIAGQADRVVVMYAGRAVETGPVSEVFAHTRHPYTEALLRSMPDLETDRSKVLPSIPGLPPDLTNPPHGCRFAARCPYAQDRCRHEDPALVQDESHPDHSYACFYPVESRDTEAGGAPVVAAESGRASSSRTETGAGAESGGIEDRAADVIRQPVLVIENAIKEFPITHGVLQRQAGSVKAVSDVSFTVYEGEAFGLVGESGCGKTTLSRLIAGLEKPDSGRILLRGTDLAGLHGRAMRQARRRVQMVFQDPYASLDPRMNVRSILREPLTAQRIGTRREQDGRIENQIGEVGLSKQSLVRYPHQFSGGQRQRIGLARALVLEPSVVVADEPVSALDVSIQSQVLNLLRRLQQERNLTYVVVSHDLAVVRYLADRVGVMYLGKLVEIGPATEIYERPAHHYTAALLDSAPVAIPREGPTTPLIKGEPPSPANPPSGCRFRTRCPHAQEICAREEPKLEPIGAPGHNVACHSPRLPRPAAG